jgi:hypothetical protein
LVLFNENSYCGEINLPYVAFFERDVKRHNPHQDIEILTQNNQQWIIEGGRRNTVFYLLPSSVSL